ncbi:MAG: hypothetical protein LQ351_001537 [Letrouitia transgressa]|nr:MAG: hypothetical protein LQ351_001537 [Letrouitia transgressa]
MCAQLTNQCRQLFPPADGDSSKNGGKIAAKPSAEYQGPGQETTLEELGKDDWETVEKPHERAESQSTSVSEEGVKIERGPESEIPTKNQLLRDCSSKPNKRVGVTLANPTQSTSELHIKGTSSSSSSPPKRRRVKFMTQVPFRPSASSFTVSSTPSCPSHPRPKRFIPHLTKYKRGRVQAPASRYSPYFNPNFHVISSTELLEEYEKEAEMRICELRSETRNTAEKKREIERIVQVGDFTAETCRLNDVPGNKRGLEEAMEGLLVQFGFTPKEEEAKREEQEIE